MDRQDYQCIRKWSNKIRAIQYLGSKCENCGDDSIFHMVFHHLKPKDKEANCRVSTPTKPHW